MTRHGQTPLVYQILGVGQLIFVQGECCVFRPSRDFRRHVGIDVSQRASGGRSAWRGS